MKNFLVMWLLILVILKYLKMEIIANMKTGQIYIIKNKSREKLCLYKDSLWYFTKSWIKWLVDRFTKEDTERIENFILNL